MNRRSFLKLLAVAPLAALVERAVPLQAAITKAAPVIPAASCWASLKTSTPISDLMAIKRIAESKYGLNQNRIVISRKGFEVCKEAGLIDPCYEYHFYE